MTPLRAAVRSGAAWFVPLVFALSCVYASRSTFPSGYPAADISQSSVALYLAAPITAAFTAFQYRGFTTLVRGFRCSRSGIAVVMRCWWPLLIGAPLGLCAAALVTAATVPNDTSAWSLLFIDFMTVVAAALTGLAFAWAMPTVVAVPLVAILWFAWIAYGPASDNRVIHNMNSTFGCCSPDVRPSYAAIRATLLLLFVITLGVTLLIVSPHFTRVRRPVVVVVLVLAVMVGGGGAGAVLALSKQPLNLTATEPRTTALVCRVERGLQACLWPENGDRASALISIVRQLNPRLRAMRLKTIDRLTQANRDPGAISVEAGSDLSESDMRAGIAVGYVDMRSSCPGGVGPSGADSVAFVGLLAGLRPEEVRARYGARATAVATAKLAEDQHSSAAVGSWLRSDLSAVQCVIRR